MNAFDLIMSGLCALLWFAVFTISACRLKDLSPGRTLPRIGYGYILLMQTAVLVGLQPLFFRSYASWPDLLSVLAVLGLLGVDRKRWVDGAPCEYRTTPGGLA